MIRSLSFYLYFSNREGVQMIFNDFCNLIRDMVQQRLGEGVEVELQEVVKNNNVCLRGMIFKSEETNVSPTIYLDSFYYSYGRGMTGEEIVNVIVNSYRSVPENGEIDLSFFKDFEKVKEKLAYRLVNRKYNAKFLADVPFIPYMDLAICFFISYSDSVLGDGTILVQNSHMKLWNTDVRELFELAQQNTPRLYPMDMIGMEAMLEELMCEQGMPREEIHSQLEQLHYPMFVLTNTKRLHGAATILYPDLLQQVADRAEGDFYIIPSSVHEVIIVPFGEGMEQRIIKDMIYDTNRTRVEPEEVLSDSLYAYNVKDKRIIKL